MRRRALLAPGTCALLVVACTATAVRPIEYLDEATAATVTVVAQPLVFARARPELSISARDYASIVALSVNRAGRVEHLLLAHVWSTIDPRAHPAEAASPGPLLLLADGRLMRFERDARTPREAGVSVPLHAPGGTHRDTGVYRVELEALRYASASRELGLRLQGSADARRFALWKDGRPALARFLDASGAR